MKRINIIEKRKNGVITLEDEPKESKLSVILTVIGYLCLFVIGYIFVIGMFSLTPYLY